MAQTIPSILSGAAFGAALTAAGVYSPTVIISQMHLQDFHMLKAFLAASASSAVIIPLAQYLGFSSCKPRTPNTLSFLGTYSGNIVGGLLLGTGMALTGACPGTVLPQLSTAIPSAPFVVLGCLVGGILFSYLKPRLLSYPTPQMTSSPSFQKPTIYQKANIPRWTAIALYEVLLLAAITMAERYLPATAPSLVPAIWGGLIIGGAQLASLFLTTYTLGISNTYEQLGDLFWYLISPSHRPPRPSISGSAFASGTLLGSFLISKIFVLPLTAPGETIEVGMVRAVLGGVLLSFGARCAGGCTSGHGISGMSMLSVSSILSVMGMFGGGIAVSKLFL